jgi:hypothetical protein
MLDPVLRQNSCGSLNQCVTKIAQETGSTYFVPRFALLLHHAQVLDVAFLTHSGSSRQLSFVSFQLLSFATVINSDQSQPVENKTALYFGEGQVFPSFWTTKSY